MIAGEPGGKGAYPHRALLLHQPGWAEQQPEYFWEAVPGLPEAVGRSRAVRERSRV